LHTWPSITGGEGNAVAITLSSLPSAIARWGRRWTVTACVAENRQDNISGLGQVAYDFAAAIDRLAEASSVEHRLRRTEKSGGLTGVLTTISRAAPTLVRALKRSAASDFSPRGELAGQQLGDGWEVATSAERLRRYE
jgi:hypothetical protein